MVDTSRDLTDIVVDEEDGVGLSDIRDSAEQDRLSDRARRELWQQWKPSEDPEIIQFVKGSYGPNKEPLFRNFVVYMPKGGRRGRGAYVQCTCDGGKNKSAQCVPHFYYQRDMAAKRKARDEGKKVDMKSVFQPKPHYAFNIYRLSYFHKVETVEKRDDGTEFRKTTFERCKETDEIVDTNSTDCVYCLQGKERVFGQRKYYNAGQGYFDALMDIERSIGSKCKTCGGKILTVKYICAECYKEGRVTTLMDPRTTQMDKKERDAFWKTPAHCATCGKSAKPKEVIRCLNDCGQPKRRKLFDVPICVKKQGGEKFSTIVQHGPDLDPIDYDKELLEAMQPYDFAKMFATTAEAQADSMNVPNPYASGSGGVAEPGSDSIGEGALDEVPY